MSEDQSYDQVEQLDVLSLDSSRAAYAGSGSGSSSSSSQVDEIPRQPRYKRWVRLAITAVQVVLFLEAASIVAGPLVPRRHETATEEDSSKDDFDPADILMGYLTGRKGLSAVRLLSNKQLQEAVDNLVTEDYEELDVKDKGKEIRQMIAEIIEMREQQAKEGNSGKASSNRAPGRVGLGKLGPLRYRSSRKHSAATAGAQAPQPARAATTVGASPPDQAAVGAAAAAAGGTLQEASSQNQQAAAAAANDGADATR
eukprot:GHRR01006935.1.p1 GENE.GHRR01006935.1~~GHRR01006935.1.p1  ORF type:complete len:256 (+),score=115.80 GHRR01006935.1:133-900(+)